MLRTALAVTLVTAASLGAQSQQQRPEKLSQADSAAIFAAARSEVARLANNPNSSDQMVGTFAAPAHAHRMRSSYAPTPQG